MMSNLRTRARSAGFSRGAALSADVNLLQQTIKQLQEQLLNTKAENQKIREQLACLSSLVKRAWTGDTSAVQHVANIVGVAPPEIQQSHQNNLDQNHFIVTAQPKSRVLNNWARLTIGILNKQYCHLEREIEDEQRRHLFDRSQYLDGHIELGYVRPANDDRWEIVQNPGTGSAGQKTQPSKNQSRVQSAKKKPAVRHLYRPPNQKGESSTEPRMTWGEVVPEHQQHDKPGYEKDCLLNKLSNRHGYQGPGDPYRNNYPVDYTDPYKYSTDGLFDEDTVIGPGAGSNVRRQRPPSGKEQRQADLVRSRPKSAILPKGERPLKYETTRPISTKGRGVAPPMRTASTGDLHNGQRNTPGPGSGKQWIKSHKGHTFITNGGHDDSQMPFDLNDLDLKEPAKSRLQNHNGLGDSDDEKSWHSEDEELAARKKTIEEILVKIKKPESVINYEKELSRMGLMEEEFKNKTLMLQKKLGIPTGGLVEP